MLGEGMEELKEQKTYALTLAGATVGCSFTFPDTFRCFGDYICGYYEGEGQKLSPATREDWERLNGSFDTFAEYSAFTVPVSDALLKTGRCIIHAAAFRFEDRAYLIAAPSGVGKSTQVRTLMELYPDEIAVISGDRPVLEATEDGIMVHPSPWNGKEGWCGAEAAPLAAIILLERGDENSIRAIPSKNGVVRVFTSLFMDAESEDGILRAASFTDTVLKHTPVWEYVNAGVPDSSRMLYEKVLKEAELYGV